MGNNIVIANIKSTNLNTSINKVSASNNIVTPTLNVNKATIQAKNTSTFYDDVFATANLEKKPLKEYTFEELLAEGQKTAKLAEQEREKNVLEDAKEQDDIQKLIELYAKRSSNLGFFDYEKEMEIEKEIKILENKLNIAHRPDTWEDLTEKQVEKKEEFIYIPFNYSNIENDGYTAQGITTTDKGYIVSAHNGHVDNSRLYLYDKNGNYSGLIILDNNAHVGGVTYDSENGLIYVTGGAGAINIYSYDTICEILKENPKNNEIPLTEGKYKDVKVGTLNDLNLGKNAATMYYKDGYIYTSSYVGNNTSENSTVFAKYKVNYKKDKDGDVTSVSYETVYETTGAISKQVQGIAITEYKGKEYLIVSEGNVFTNSSLKVYELGANGVQKYCGEVLLDFSGAEGVQIQDNGQVVVISESADKTQVLSMNEIFVEMNDFKPLWYLPKKIVDIGAGWGYDGGVISIWDKAFKEAEDAGDYADIAIDKSGKTVNVILDQIGLDIKDGSNSLAEDARDIPLVGGFLGGAVEFGGGLADAIIDGAGDTFETGMDYFGDGIETVYDCGEYVYEFGKDCVEVIGDFFSSW